MRVTVVIGNESDPSQVLLAALGPVSLRAAFPKPEDENLSLALISWSAPSQCPFDINQTVPVGSLPLPWMDTILNKPLALRLLSKLRKHPIGRLIISCGPADTGRVFWRRVRTQPELVHLLDSSDVLIAADSAATRACWHSSKRNPKQSAYFGIQAAIKIQESRS